jgi:glyoxylase-like metal-dependent hydrolase (beta-lactamase superfamily II)
MAVTGFTTERYGEVSVLVGGERGAHPHANSLLIRGTSETLVIDPSLSLADGAPPADLVLVSHAHEDHIAGLGSYDVPVHVHREELEAVRSREALVAILGLPPDAAEALDEHYRDTLQIQGRPDATAFEDGAVFDLGGRTVTVVHLPGHTPGHCGFLIEPDGFLLVADIDLTSFGPYYGDVGSDLTEFMASMERCAEIEARWYGTSHQKGVIEGAAEFRRRLETYASIVARRDENLLTLLGEPRSLDEIADHRLIYRSHVQGPHVAPVERRTAARHLDRLIATGQVAEVEQSRFRAT